MTFKRTQDEQEELFVKRIKQMNPTKDDFDKAAMDGDLEKMKSLKNNGCEFGDYTLTNAMEHAVKNKTTDNLIWLRENNIMKSNEYFGLECMELICFDNRFEQIKYLKEAGYDLSEYGIMKHAVSSGNIRDVKWCIENGLPFDDSMFQSLYNVQIREFLVQNGCPFSYNGRTCFEILTQETDYSDMDEGYKIEYILDALNFLTRKGCPFGSAIELSRFCVYPKLLKWLKENKLV